ncbi:hypothetical protein [Deinococcus sp. YIM 77859]|uniref:hypothetical protein n=1 Tax=Deinococcus sp. YIM 77859 TaxID=1540221 RepID=UPI000554F4C1|nr:hypothetical protein [Deinococcus sp. YIM 77859]
MIRALLPALLAAVLLAVAWWLTPHAALGAPLVNVTLALAFTGGFGSLITALARAINPEV